MSIQRKIEREFINWTKGSTGLVVTKVALSEHIMKTWKNKLDCWDKDDILHLPTFLQDIDEASERLVYEKQQEGEGKGNMIWKTKCQCKNCQSIFKHLLSFHKNQSKKIVWNPTEKVRKEKREKKHHEKDNENKDHEEDNEEENHKEDHEEENHEEDHGEENHEEDHVEENHEKDSEEDSEEESEEDSEEESEEDFEEESEEGKCDLFKMVHKQTKMYVEKFDDICNICKKQECPFERSRRGISLFDPNKKYQTDEKQKETIDEHFWQIANMYMFRGNERNKVPNSGPEDTDAALVLKMMKNCNLFEAKDNVYDELLEVRNLLMHTPDQRLPKKALNESFKRMKKLLKMGKLKDDKNCKLALLELSKLKKMVIITSYLSHKEKDMIKKALDEQQRSLEFEIKVTGNLKNEELLTGYLKASIEKSKVYAEKDQSEQGLSEDKPKQDLTEDKPKQGSSEDKPKQNQSEVKSKKGSSKSSATTLGGAATGAAVGSIAGPPGAAIGAAVGWFFGKLAE